MIRQCASLRFEISWLSEQAVVNAPDALRSWLLDPSSLTTKLSRAYQAELKVNVLTQDWGVPSPHELQLLGAMAKEYRCYIIRRVQLLLNGVPKVYARSIFPVNYCDQTYWYVLNRFKRTPLGCWLFTSSELVRSSFKITCIQGHQLASDSGAGPEKTLWGRCSTFSLHGLLPCLVMEFFLETPPFISCV